MKIKLIIRHLSAEPEKVLQYYICECPNKHGKWPGWTNWCLPKASFQWLRSERRTSVHQVSPVKSLREWLETIFHICYTYPHCPKQVFSLSCCKQGCYLERDVVEEAYYHAYDSFWVQNKIICKGSIIWV